MKLMLIDSTCSCSRAEEGVWTSWGTKTSLSLSLGKNSRGRGKDSQLSKVSFGKRSSYLTVAQSDKNLTFSTLIGCFTTTSQRSSLNSSLSQWLVAMVKWHPWSVAPCDEKAYRAVPQIAAFSTWISLWFCFHFQEDCNKPSDWKYTNC